jgi:hypothetical protein
MAEVILVSSRDPLKISLNHSSRNATNSEILENSTDFLTSVGAFSQSLQGCGDGYGWSESNVRED